MDEQTLPGGSQELTVREGGQQGRGSAGDAARSRISQPRGLDTARKEPAQAALPCQHKARGEPAGGARPRLFRGAGM